MTDENFQKAINQTALALQKYHGLLKIAEDEFERRFDNHPSDINCDTWIDALHVTGFGASVKDITEDAQLQ